MWGHTLVVRMSVCHELVSPFVGVVFPSITTITRPPSAGCMTMPLSFSSRFNACNSSFVKLQSVSEVNCRVEPILLLMSSLVNSGSSL